MRSTLRHAVVMLAVCAACDDSNDNERDTDRADAAVTAGDAAVAGATFTQVYGLISEQCTGCHRPREQGPAGGLDLSSKATAYSQLVSVASAASAACAGRVRVVPGDAEQSLLYEKVEPEPSCGSRMPRNGTPLSDDQIELIESWIAAGALDN